MLYELIKPYSSISTVGMCKNAGKTTVLNRIITECDAADEIIGITSVGRDGERSDIVTSTKKPEIFIREGTLIATAEDALPLGDFSREILFTTGMPTPMGEVVIVRAHSDGFVQIAGPSMTAQLRVLKAHMTELGAQRVIIDGALSRKSLAQPVVSDAAILCTGASYSRDMQKTVADTAFSAALMGLPAAEHHDSFGEKKFTALTESERVEFDIPEDAADLIRKQGAQAVLIKGGLTDKAAEALLCAGRALAGPELVLEDGSRLLITLKTYEKLLRAGARFAVRERTRLVAVTVNPFSAYGVHYDKNAFIEAVRAAVPAGVPVLDAETGLYYA